MIKECSVLLNNADVTVVKWDNIEVQIPAIGKKAKTIKVQKIGDLYIIAKDLQDENKPKKAAKKTTSDISAEDAVVPDAEIEK